MNTGQGQTGRHGATTRRIAMATTAVLVVLAAGATPTAAFEPPADPNDNFGCDGGPVNGHPGRGLATAMAHAASPTAWNAVNNAAPITLCD